MTTTEAAAHRLREITQSISELKGQAALVLYQLGALLVEVDEAELWRAGDFAHFTDYLERSLDVSTSTARRAMAVARHFNAGMVERYGIEKLSAGVRYMELTNTTERPGDLVAANLRVRGESGRFESVGFHEATSRQVRQAVAVLRAPQARGVPAEEKAQVERLNQALRNLGAGSVRARRRSGGELVLSFRDVPIGQLAALAEALRGEE